MARVAASGWYLLGPELERFEQEFASYCGTRHCVGVGSGMSAIELALLAAGIGPGDEVIVPAYTWIATWLAVTRTGATPVGVDAVESTYNIDPGLIAAAITERTAAIVPVHLRGEPADMDAIGAIAADAGLFVVEDAAQAHGARCSGRRVGSIGDAGAFSFYPTKNLGCLGDGGAVTTDDDALAERLRLLRNYGMRNRYEIEIAGVNSRLAEIQAAVLRLLLPRLDGWNRARSSLAGAYLRRPRRRRRDLAAGRARLGGAGLAPVRDQPPRPRRAAPTPCARPGSGRSSTTPCSPTRPRLTKSAGPRAASRSPSGSPPRP